MTKNGKVQVHRFRESVAISLMYDGTHYLTPLQAELLGKALISGAKDCRKTPFTESTLPTLVIEDIEVRE